MAGAQQYLALLLVLLLALQAAVLALRQLEPNQIPDNGDSDNRHKKKKKRPYTSPAGLFIQERASKQLPGPGQHFSFGALKPWEEILDLLDGKENRKLLLVVRHGQAISNYLSDTLGPDEWFRVEGTCQYDDKAGNIYNVFDADLTGLGTDQARSLNSMLLGGKWFDKVGGGLPARAIVSPLTRCLHTATLVLEGLHLNATNVEEFVRETLGEDTCDARRSVTDPDVYDDRRGPEGPCSFDKGLRSTYPQFKYRVYDPRDDADRGFGLLGDSDHLWTKDKRERQKHQVKRAKKFLDILFEQAPEPVVVVVTHSGFTRSILLAVAREPYRPQNAELVPVLVEKSARREEEDFGDELWLDEAVQGYEDAWEEAIEQLQLEKQQKQKQQQQQQQTKQPSGCMLSRAMQLLWQWVQGQ